MIGWKNIYNIMRLNERSLMNIYRSMMIMLIRTFYWNNWGEIIHYFIYILEFSYQHCLTCLSVIKIVSPVLSVINIVSPVYQLSTLSHLFISYQHCLGSFISYQHCLTCLSVINIVSPVNTGYISSAKKWSENDEHLW